MKEGLLRVIRITKCDITLSPIWRTKFLCQYRKCAKDILSTRLLKKKTNRLYLPLAASSARNQMLHCMFVGNANAAGIVFATFFFDIALLLPRRSVTLYSLYPSWIK